MTQAIPEANIPKYLSPSSVSTYLQCPLKYRYSRIDKIPEPTTEPQIVGSITHEVLEFLHRLPSDQRSLRTARQILLDRWNEEWSQKIDEDLGLGPYDKHLLRWNVWRCVENYFEYEDPSMIELDGIEHRLEAEVNGVPVLGIIDRWQRCDDGTILIGDYKTGKVSRPPYDKEKQFQLLIYVDLVEAVLGETVSAAELLYLKGNKVTVKSYLPTEENRADTRQTLSEVWEGVKASCESGEFRPRKHRLCDWCSYKSICPLWSSNDSF